LKQIQYSTHVVTTNLFIKASSIQIGFEKQLAKVFISFCFANCFSKPIWIELAFINKLVVITCVLY